MASLSWEELAHSARRFGLAAAVSRRLQYLHTSWRAQLPPGYAHQLAPAALRTLLDRCTPLADDETRVLRLLGRWPTLASLRAQVGEYGSLPRALLARLGARPPSA
jgi:hypothetical protein